MSLPLSQAAVADTFHTLVRQFSQELSFYRELIQNALDAGTNRVEVSLEYDKGRGMAVAVVQDDGEGMDRKTIDTRLTCMFSSDKENDLARLAKKVRPDDPDDPRYRAGVAVLVSHIIDSIRCNDSSMTDDQEQTLVASLAEWVTKASTPTGGGQ